VRVCVVPLLCGKSAIGSNYGKSAVSVMLYVGGIFDSRLQVTVIFFQFTCQFNFLADDLCRD